MKNAHKDRRTFQMNFSSSERAHFEWFPPFSVEINFREKVGRQNERFLSCFGSKMAPLSIRLSVYVYLGACLSPCHTVNKFSRKCRGNFAEK